MHQQDLFDQPGRIELDDESWLLWYPEFYPLHHATDLYDCIENTLAWSQLPVTMFGRKLLQPRLQAWHGDHEYTYSGLTLPPSPMPDVLNEIKSECEKVSQATFNSVLVNYYRDGCDYMGWHQDNEKELGETPVIASVSLGETRRFVLRHLKTKEKKEFELNSGSMLVMGGRTQTFWQHTVPKTAKPRRGRINLTYRKIISNH
ncbi:alpha-ketoglutarate-dependent dioxygenase AlkB family protein [Veronia pacifica]|uniref:DNA repair protein n=1 Tax=Veronia pacifica TaxID=1080227 RepID=A0A1C3ECW7_9GAMM|nr:alpha-ketoglutarate-dependent dioxygenase AlkB [Veronia pacifica]ODA31097.1 DNA repair protein [Veronia pacifica]